MAQIEGGSSAAGKANVDANFNLQVRTPTTNGLEGFSAASSETDAGGVTGSRLVLALEATEDYRLRVGTDKPDFLDVFVGSTINTGLWCQPATLNGATVTCAGGFAVLTTGTTLNGHAVIKSRRHFQVQPTFPLYFECLADFSQAPVNNTVTDWGLAIVDALNTAVAPTDGAFFRITNAGALVCVVSCSGTETIATPTGGFSTLIGVSTVRHFIVSIQDNFCAFWIDNVLVARIARPTAASGITRSLNFPAFARSYNPTAPAATSISRFAYIAVIYGDADSGKSWPAVLAGSGGHASQGQTGQTLGSTGQYTNNTNPGAATPTNTTAALGTGLGGNFLCNAQATVATDFIISSFAVPAGTVTAPGKTLYIYGVWIDAINTVVAVATTPTSIILALNYGHTGVSLATAESVNVKGARRIPLGAMTWPVGAAVGAMPTNGGVYRAFTVPVVVHEGEFVAISAKFVTGTATATEVLQFAIGFDAVFE